MSSPSTHLSNKNTKIRIDFKSPTGVIETSRSKREELIGKSAEAMHTALGMIQEMAERTAAVINSIRDENHQPNQVDIEFGIDFDSEVGVLVAKTGVNASIKVKLTWTR